MKGVERMRSDAREHGKCMRSPQLRFRGARGEQFKPTPERILATSNFKHVLLSFSHVHVFIGFGLFLLQLGNTSLEVSPTINTGGQMFEYE